MRYKNFTAGSTPEIVRPLPVPNINTATKEELTLLPGIGPTYAQRIIKYRKKYGLFKNISEITKIYGIGKNKFEKIKDKITVHKTQK